jgi:hypothetical protein
LENGRVRHGVYAELLNGDLLVNIPLDHTTPLFPTVLLEESLTSGSFVLVALTALFVRDKSPVTNDPAPAYVLEVLLGLFCNVSPNCTIAPEPTLNILTAPTMDGIGATTPSQASCSIV